MRYDAGLTQPRQALMFALYGRFLDLALMRLPPQAFPASHFLLGLTLAAFLLMAAFGNYMAAGDSVYAIARALLSAFNIAAGAGVILLIARRSARWQQTVAALYGGECVLMVFMLPVLFAYALEIDNVFVLLSQWLMIVWELVFIGHVYRNALETGMGGGVLIAVIYVLVSTAVKQAVLPFPA